MAGTYVLIPGGTPHDFENRGNVPAGFVSINMPGGFDARMADIQPALAGTELKI